MKPAAAGSETESQTPEYRKEWRQRMPCVNASSGPKPSELLFTKTKFKTIVLTFLRFSKLMRPPCEHKEESYI